MLFLVRSEGLSCSSGAHPCEMNSQLSGNSQEFLRIPRNSQKFPTMQISLHQISLEFLRIFGNGKLGLTLGLEFLGIPRNSKFYNFRSLRIVENFWEQKNSGQLGLEFLAIPRNSKLCKLAIQLRDVLKVRKTLKIVEDFIVFSYFFTF